MNKKIVIDVLGGDNAPDELLNGVVSVAKDNPELEFVLVGDEKEIKKHVTQAGLSSRVEIVHSTENIGCDEPPTAVRNKPNSSISLAMDALRTREDVGAFVSAGSTGAVLAAAVLKIGRIAGVSRPGLCPIFPTSTAGVNTYALDIGANMDCRPEQLLHFAIMGSEFAKSRGVKNPRVALVNVGHEDTKGNELTTTVFGMLKKSDLNFVGNMEARDAFSGKYDVIVCDGFVGNVLLKTAEGIFSLLGKEFRRALTRTFLNKLGALLVRKNVKKIKEHYDYNKVGGSVFLGTKKPVIKAHGSSNAFAFSRAIMLAVDAARNDLCANIAAAIERNKVDA